MTLASRLLRHKNGAAANAFERWLDAEGQMMILEDWRQRRANLAAMSDPSEAATAFMQQTIEAYRQAVANRIGSIA